MCICNLILIRVSCRARTPMPQSHGLQGGWGTRLYRLGFCKADTLQGRAASHFPGVYHSVNGACRPPVLHGIVRNRHALVKCSHCPGIILLPRLPTRSQSSHVKKTSAPLQTPAWRADCLTGARTASAGTPGGIPCALRSSRGLCAISRRGSGIVPRVATLLLLPRIHAGFSAEILELFPSPAAGPDSPPHTRETLGVRVGVLPALLPFHTRRNARVLPPWFPW